MSDLALDLGDDARNTDRFGDLVFGATGDLILSQGAEAVRQALLLRLQASVGDYFMAPNDGIPWLDMLGSTQGYTDAFDAVLRNTVLNTPGVSGLLTWDLAFNQTSRVLTIAMQVETATGIINFSLPVGEGGAI